ncbi:unnamed protein product, partial [Mesorhabditis spiculigera]
MAEQQQPIDDEKDPPAPSEDKNIKRRPSRPLVRTASDDTQDDDRNKDKEKNRKSKTGEKTKTSEEEDGGKKKLSKTRPKASPAKTLDDDKPMKSHDDEIEKPKLQKATPKFDAREKTADEEFKPAGPRKSKEKTKTKTSEEDEGVIKKNPKKKIPRERNKPHMALKTAGDDVRTAEDQVKQKKKPLKSLEKTLLEEEGDKQKPRSPKSPANPAGSDVMVVFEEEEDKPLPAKSPSKAGVGEQTPGEEAPPKPKLKATKSPSKAALRDGDAVEDVRPAKSPSAAAAEFTANDDVFGGNEQGEGRPEGSGGPVSVFLQQPFPSAAPVQFEFTGGEEEFARPLEPLRPPIQQVVPKPAPPPPVVTTPPAPGRPKAPTDSKSGRSGRKKQSGINRGGIKQNRIIKKPPKPATPEGLGHRLKGQKPKPKENAVDRAARKARAKIECAGFNKHLLKAGDDILAPSGKKRLKNGGREEDEAATSVRIQDVGLREGVVLVKNKDNGGKLFVKNRPFWTSPHNDDDTNEECPIASSVVLAVAKGMKLAEPPEESVVIDPFAPLADMQARDKKWFSKDLVFGNTVRGIIYAMSTDDGTEPTPPPGPGLPHVSFAKKPPGLMTSYSFDPATHDMKRKQVPYMRSGLGVLQQKKRLKNRPGAPSPKRNPRMPA